MYEIHPLLKDPPSGNHLWRYFTFTKLISMLETRSLFFPQADSFEDPFEGSWPKKELENRNQRRIEELQAQYMKEEDIQMAIQHDSQYYRSTRKFTLLSCWHYNDSESAAMWKLFPKTEEGVAVCTTVERLKAGFQDYLKPVYMGMVYYIDYETGNFLAPADLPFVAYIHKRLQFEHEKEYRLVLPLEPGYEMAEEGRLYGRYIPVDIDMLIDKIYVAPDAPEWYFRLLNKMLKGFGLQKEVVPSSLSLKPVF